MTKWKQRRREREQLLQQFAVASLPVFLDMIITQSIKHNPSALQVKELRQTAAECAWTHAEIMLRTRNHDN
jgi:hypothetical protein